MISSRNVVKPQSATPAKSQPKSLLINVGSRVEIATEIAMIRIAAISNR